MMDRCNIYILRMYILVAYTDFTFHQMTSMESELHLKSIFDKYVCLILPFRPNITLCSCCNKIVISTGEYNCIACNKCGKEQCYDCKQDKKPYPCNCEDNKYISPHENYNFMPSLSESLLDKST